jgi:hypothetical protein
VPNVIAMELAGYAPTGAVCRQLERVVLSHRAVRIFRLMRARESACMKSTGINTRAHVRGQPDALVRIVQS